MSRKCARSACPNPATATLSYSYGDGVVWIEDLIAEAHPMLHDLCAVHADSLRVPLGWVLRDERVQGHSELQPRAVGHGAMGHNDGAVSQDSRLDLIGA